MKKLLVMTMILVAAGVIFWALERPTSGVREPVWNKTACAHCRMHVGVPSYAAQIQTRDGEVADFDDPGCLFEWVADNSPPIRAAYFHHYRQERWLNFQEVGFIRVEEDTPMGFGLGAVDKAAHPEAMSFGEASNVVLNAGGTHGGRGQHAGGTR